MLCYAIVQLQKPLVIIFINVLYSLTTIGTGNLNCNKWDTKLDQSDRTGRIAYILHALISLLQVLFTDGQFENYLEVNNNNCLQYHYQE